MTMKTMAKRTKTTFTIRQFILEDFTKACDLIGLRRDTYLNLILPKAIHLFDQSPKENSSAAEKISKLLRTEEPGGLKKLVVSLEGQVLQNLNTVCQKKKVSRDVFFEEVLCILVYGDDNDLGSEHRAETEYPYALKNTANFICNPWRDWLSHDGLERGAYAEEEIQLYTGVEADLHPPFPCPVAVLLGDFSISTTADIFDPAFLAAAEAGHFPTENFSPFDGIVIGTVPMGDAIKIVEKCLENLTKRKLKRMQEISDREEIQRAAILALRDYGIEELDEASDESELSSDQKSGEF
jgi:hypothetical protein